MVRPEWPYAAAREQILSDESGGCSGAEEVAGEARPSQGASPQANAERVRREADKGRAMTTLTMRLVKGDFIGAMSGPVTMKFKSRREAKDWCKVYHPASSITEIGPGGQRAAAKKLPPREGR